MIIRSARIDDVDALARLAGEFGYPSTPDEIRARFAMLAPGDDILVAESDGIVEAWMHVAVLVSLESGALAQIRGLVVTEQRRGIGIGAELVKAAERWARARGLTRLRVLTNTVRKRTHVFYERCGFALKKDQRQYEKSV